MKELSIKEIQGILLEILKEIDFICRKNNIKYTLSNGTLLGAVRHKGFIPWDNDADVRMPRPDYDRFIEYCLNNDTKFKLFNVKTDKKCYIPFSRLYDTDTLYVRKNYRYNFGCFVDIFPMDGIGKEPNELNEKNVNLQKFILYMNQFTLPPISREKKLRTNIFHFLYFCQCKISGAEKICQRFFDNVSEWTYEDSDYVTNLSTRNDRKNVYPKDMYENVTDMDFEGCRFSCIKDYDTYLTNEYGDYMTLPPENERGAHHKFKICYK